MFTFLSLLYASIATAPRPNVAQYRITLKYQVQLNEMRLFFFWSALLLEPREKMNLRCNCNWIMPAAVRLPRPLIVASLPLMPSSDANDIN